MIASSTRLKIGAALVAAGVHLVASGALAPEQIIELESSAGAAQARLGSSFADMSAGTLTPAEVDNEAAQAEPETAEPIEPPETLTADSARPVEAPQPEAVASESPTPDTIAPSDPSTLAPSDPIALTPSDPTALAVLASPKPVEAQPAKPLVAPTPPPPDQVIAAAPDDPGASSPRPKRRDPELAAKRAPPKPKAVKQAQKKAAPKAKTEKSKANNIQGSATGTRTAKARTQGTQAGRAKESGNAAASNYPGKVLRRISRVRKPRAQSRSRAVISFAVASNGALRSVSVARSSGSSRFDQAAVGVIRKAAPFPAPPRGAKRSFNITIKSN